MSQCYQARTFCAPNVTLYVLFTRCTARVQAVYDAADPVSSPLPSPWSTKVDAFQRLLLLRVLRPDMLTTAIHSFVKGSMGQRFVESPPLDLEVCYGDSTATSPLIFVLSPGSDPMSMLLKFAERLKCQVRQCHKYWSVQHQAVGQPLPCWGQLNVYLVW